MQELIQGSDNSSKFFLANQVQSTVLIHGGRLEFNMRAIVFEREKTDGLKLFFSGSLSEAQAILSRQVINLIVIEAFIDNGNYETLFDFLLMRKQSELLTRIPVVVVAAEPSKAGLLFAPSTSRLAEFLGASKFVYMPEFHPEIARSEIASCLSSS